MSELRRMVFKLDPNNREAEGQLVERYLTALGYEDAGIWNDERRHDNTRKNIFVDGVKFMYFTDDCHELATIEPIPTPYQVAVAEHMSTAPQELAEYVRERLVCSDEWKESQRPILSCGFSWRQSVEGYDFWTYIDIKNWPKVMTADFWKKQTVLKEKESKQAFNNEQFRQAVESQNTTESMKGKIGYWYTLLEDVLFKLEHNEVITYTSGFTWQCARLDDKGNPLLEKFVIPTSASYRLATIDELFNTLQKSGFTVIGKASEQFAEIFEDKKHFNPKESVDFKAPIGEPKSPVESDVVESLSSNIEEIEIDEKLIDIYSVDEVLLFYQMRAVESILKHNNKKAIDYLKKVDQIRDQQ